MRWKIYSLIFSKVPLENSWIIDWFVSVAENRSTAPKDPLTLSFLLNLSDGIIEQPSRILIMTSNHPEQIDQVVSILNKNSNDVQHPLSRKWSNFFSMKKIRLMFFNFMIMFIHQLISSQYVCRYRMENLLYNYLLNNQYQILLLKQRKR